MQRPGISRTLTLASIAAAGLGGGLGPRPAIAGGPVVVTEFERDADGWMYAAPCHEAYSFDQFHPGVASGGGCLVPPGPVGLELVGGDVTLTATDGGGAEYCAVRDSATSPAVSDGAVIAPATILTLGFSPPATAFYTYYGSMAVGTTATMTLYATGMGQVAQLTSAPSPHASQATGHGFVSNVPIDAVEITFNGDTAVLVGAFAGLASGEPPLGTITIPGYDGPGLPFPSIVQLDFAVAFDGPDRVHNVTIGTWHRCISDAIASCVDGEVLVAEPSVYREAIDLNGKAITVRSIDPADPDIVAATVIDGGNLNRSTVTCAGGEGRDTVLRGFTITGGQGTSPDGPGGQTFGGGMYLFGASPTVDRCVLIGNRADQHGGGAYAGWASSPAFTDCTFSSNTAPFGGGLAVATEESVTVSGCAFSGNSATSRGGGLYARDAFVAPVGCTFTGNQAQHGGAIAAAVSEAACQVAPEACVFSGNSVSSDGGAVWGSEAAFILTGCDFLGNSASRAGAAFISGISAGSEIRNCRFLGNSASVSDDAEAIVFIKDNGEGVLAAIEQCLFSGNHGIGVMAEGGSATVEVGGCTFSRNVPGGAIQSNIGALVYLTNSILWEDELPEIIIPPGKTGGQVIVSHCSVMGAGLSTDGNLDLDPLFADADGPDGVAGTPDDDLRLAAGSPCVNAGLGTYDPGDPQVDLDGLPRHQGPIDMGAYEHPVDCDASGTPDYVEIEGGLLADCNGNLQFDGCESVIDCNANGIMDECDIASGLLTDANGNNFADECEAGGVLGGTNLWTTADHPVVLVTQDALVSGSLSIEQGVLVRFAGGTKMTVLSGGSLTVEGTPEEPVRFTSTRVEPEAGDWDGLHYAPGSSGALTGAVIEYTRSFGVRLEGASIPVAGCTIREVAGIDQPRPPSGTPAAAGGPAYGLWVSGAVSPLITDNLVEQVRGGNGGAGAYAVNGSHGADGAPGNDWGDDGANAGNALNDAGAGGAGAAGGPAIGVFGDSGTSLQLAGNTVRGIAGGAGGAGGPGGLGGYGGLGGDGVQFNVYDLPPVCAGGDGGDGGNGANGGDGGAGGAGGAAWGVRLASAAGGTIHQNLVAGIAGGAGGAGGPGGRGGDGGGGGSGGVGISNSVAPCIDEGPGPGGDGGNAGAGSDGGFGGAGGAAHGVAVGTTSTVLVSVAQNTIAQLANGPAGAAGEAGDAGNPGPAGEGALGFFYDPICHCIPIPFFADDGQAGFGAGAGLFGVAGGVGAVTGMSAEAQAQAVAVNTIIEAAGSTQSTGVTATGGASLLVSSSNLFGFTTTFGPGTNDQGAGNLLGDPMFVDAAGGDLHLAEGSPAIDAGSNASVPGGIATDLDGDARILDGDGDDVAVVDIGADEFGGPPCPADLDGDGSVGIADLLALLAAWATDPGGPPDLDGDGAVGIADLLATLAAWGPCE